MNDKQRRLYDRIKTRYDAYLMDKAKCDLLMIVLRKDDADILSEIGFKRTQSLMRSEIPALLKAFELFQSKPEEISLFR